MKIAYFTDTYAPEVNGVTSTFDKLSVYLERKGVQHVFFAPDYKNAQAQRSDTTSKTKSVHRFPGVKVGMSPNSCLSFPKASVINRLCDRFAPDVVHVSTEFGIGYRGMKYAVSRKLPLIMSCHTDYCKYLKFFGLTPLQGAIETYLKWFYGFSQKTLVPSMHTLECLEEKAYKNLGIWTRGVDAGIFSKRYKSDNLRHELGADGKFAFLYVGRLSPEKGLDLLLHAVREVNNRFPNKAIFVFTGDGPYANIIRQSGISNIVMTGFKRGHELSEIYASCDCFAMPSGTETFGNTILEAMSSGLPVAGIASGGATDYLRHGYNALLSAEGSKDAFTRNLVAIMENEELRKTLSENGLKTAMSRDWDGIFDRLLLDYAAVIKENLDSLPKQVS